MLIAYKIDPDLDEMQAMCIKSFVANGTEFRLYTQKRTQQLRICNAVIKMSKQNNLGKKTLSRIQDKLTISTVDDIAWTEIVARYLADEIKNFNLEFYIVVPEVFCPNGFDNFRDLALSNDVKFDSRTYGVRLWNSMWN